MSGGGSRPPVWQEMLARAWRTERSLTIMVALLMLGQLVVTATIGVALRWTVTAVVHDARAQLLAAALVAAAGIGVQSIGLYLLIVFRNDLADQVGYRQVDPTVQRLTAELESLEHIERSEYLDRLGLLVGKGQVLVNACLRLVELSFLVGQVLLVLVLLGAVHPGLVGLGVFALPGALFSRVAGRSLRRATLAASAPARLERHLHEVTTAAAAGKELRVYDAADTLIGNAADAWHRATVPQLRARVLAAVMSTAGTLIFLVGFAAALLYVADLVSTGRRSVADLVLVVVLASQLRISIGYALGSFSEMQVGLALGEPYRWLLDYAETRRVRGRRLPAPRRLTGGITLHEVSFAYPAARRPALGPIDAHLPAGAMVALVGEHGSGKTTLVKLLCKLYPAGGGRIEVDGVPLDTIATDSWRTVTTAAFQDFARYQVRMRYAVGLGDIVAAADDERLLRAIQRAGADVFYKGLLDGLETPLGRSFDNGHEPSEGQWQKTALARACMRQEPLLVVLDEPTASLDAPSEHAIFQRHAALARDLGQRYGTITVVVSHRFSTVRMADLILVLKGGCVVERGSHSELMNRDGTYAELYRMQEVAYRV